MTKPSGCHLTGQHHRSPFSPAHFQLPSVAPQSAPLASLSTTMSSIAAMASRRAFARRPFLRAPPRRFYSSKIEEADLDKGPRRDPELYV